LWCIQLCCGVFSCVVVYSVVLCCIQLCCGVFSCVVFSCAVLYSVVLWCIQLCCGVFSCVVVYSVVLCCIQLCCGVFSNVLYLVPDPIPNYDRFTIKVTCHRSWEWFNMKTWSILGTQWSNNVNIGSIKQVV